MNSYIDKNDSMDRTASASKEGFCLSLVFSFRNEEKTIPLLLDRVIAVMEKEAYHYELLFIDDASTDASLEILLQARQSNPSIKILSMSRRFGVHPCVMAGLEASAGDAVIYMDADLQDPPELIPRLIDAWQQGADVVHTRRTERLGESRWKMAITLLAYKVVDALSDVRIPSNCGDFKLLSRRALNQLLRLKEKNPFMRGLTYWIGFHQAYVDYVRESRAAGTTHFSLFSLGPMREFERGVITFSTLPLRFALVLGLLAAGGAFFYLPFLLAGKWLGWNLPGWTGIMCAIALLNGLVLFTIGITGLYISRIYDEVRGRPSYILREAWGFEKKVRGPSFIRHSMFESGN